jgi:hypothetical protein
MVWRGVDKESGNLESCDDDFFPDVFFEDER